MKKLLLLTLTAMMMVGCGGVKRNNDGSILLDKYYNERSVDNPYLEIIDSCEYLIWHSRMTHKGNCKYCAERRKQELKELIKELKDK